MKKILEIAAVLSASLLVLVSCEKTDYTGPEYLGVTSTNIAGTWQVTMLGGLPLEEGSLVYYEFVRRGSTFAMYDNLASSMLDKNTGVFSLNETDATIQGKFDYSAGSWSHTYVISELTETSMVWTAVDDPDYVTKYVRVDSIPYILGDGQQEE